MKTSPSSRSRRSVSVCLIPSPFDFVGFDWSMSTPGEDVVDLPDAVHLVARLAHEGQVVRLPRLERPVVAVRRAGVVARLTHERPGDHAPDRVLAGEDLSGDPAGLVELLERNRLLVRGDLEDRVGRRVHDPLAGLLVLLAELLDDLGPGRGLVAEDAPPGAVRELLDQLERETRADRSASPPA